jgi:hypothetical protein
MKKNQIVVPKLHVAKYSQDMFKITAFGIFPNKRNYTYSIKLNNNIIY